MKKATMKKPNPGAVREARSRAAGAGQAKVKERIDVALVARGLAPVDINICTYVSLNNEITIKDIAEGLERAFRTNPKLRRRGCGCTRR